MSASPVTTRRQPHRLRTKPKQKPEELTILLLDLEGLPSTHALSAARTLSAIRGAPEFEARQLTTTDDLATVSKGRLAYYMIQSGVVVCRIIFRASEQHVAYIDAADCYTAYPHIHPRSYALFYTMAQLLEKLGFVDVCLTASKQERAFFKTIGFRRCLRTQQLHATPAEIAAAAAAVFT